MKIIRIKLFFPAALRQKKVILNVDKTQYIILYNNYF